MNSVGIRLLTAPGAAIHNIQEITIRSDRLINVVRAMNGMCDFVIDSPRFLKKLPEAFQSYLPSMEGVVKLKPIKAVLFDGKEFLAFFEWFNVANIIVSLDFWNREKTSTIMRAKQGFQFLQKSVEVVFLIPYRWKLLDLERVAASCGCYIGASLTPQAFYVFKDVSLLSASICGYCACKWEVPQVTQRIEAKESRKNRLVEVIESLKEDIEKVGKEHFIPTYDKRLTEYLKGKDSDDFKEKKNFSKMIESISDLTNMFIALQRSQLFFGGTFEKKIEQKNEEIIALKEKLLRRLLWYIGLNNHEHYNNQFPEDVQRAITFYTSLSGKHRLSILLVIAKFKVRKMEAILRNEGKDKTRNQIGRWYELSKVGVVSFGLFLKAIVFVESYKLSALSLACLGSIAGGIAVAGWMTGLIVGILCLTKTFWDTFYYVKEPIPQSYFMQWDLQTKKNK